MCAGPTAELFALTDYRPDDMQNDICAEVGRSPASSATRLENLTRGRWQPSRFGSAFILKKSRGTDEKRSFVTTSWAGKSWNPEKSLTVDLIGFLGVAYDPNRHAVEWHGMTIVRTMTCRQTKRRASRHSREAH
jgi:hypothetical protein